MALPLTCKNFVQGAPQPTTPNRQEGEGGSGAKRSECEIVQQAIEDPRALIALSMSCGSFWMYCGSSETIWMTCREDSADARRICVTRCVTPPNAAVAIQESNPRSLAPTHRFDTWLMWPKKQLRGFREAGAIPRRDSFRACQPDTQNAAELEQTWPVQAPRKQNHA